MPNIYTAQIDGSITVTKEEIIDPKALQAQSDLLGNKIAELQSDSQSITDGYTKEISKIQSQKDTIDAQITDIVAQVPAVAQILNPEPPVVSEPPITPPLN